MGLPSKELQGTPPGMRLRNVQCQLGTVETQMFPEACETTVKTTLPVNKKTKHIWQGIPWSHIFKKKLQLQGRGKLQGRRHMKGNVVGVRTGDIFGRRHSGTGALLRDITGSLNSSSCQDTNTHRGTAACGRPYLEKRKMIGKQGVSYTPLDRYPPAPQAVHCSKSPKGIRIGECNTEWKNGKVILRRKERRKEDGKVTEDKPWNERGKLSP